MTWIRSPVFRRFNGRTIWSRHGVKRDGFYLDSVPIEDPTTEHDKQRRHITNASWKDFYLLGSSLAQEDERIRAVTYATASLESSDFVRAIQSAIAFGAGVLQHEELKQMRWPMDELPKGLVLGTPDPELGYMPSEDIVIEHPDIEPFAYGEVPLDDYVTRMLTHLWFPTDDQTRPSCARFAAGGIGGVIRAIQNMRLHASDDDTHALHMAGVFSHAPMVDAGMNYLLGIVRADVDGGRVEFDTDRFLQTGGAIRMGQYSEGKVYGIDTDNPVIRWTMKGEHIETSLDQLQSTHRDLLRQADRNARYL